MAAKPHLTFPILNQKEMSQEEKEHLQQRLYAESVDMIYKFQELFTSTIASLKARDISVREISNHLRCLGALTPAYKDSKLPVFRHKLPQIQEAKDVDDVMATVNDYCSFFNYGMLEHIINKLGAEKDRLNLVSYKEEFTKYAERKVFECPSEVGEMSEEGHANMFVTLDESYNNCTVSSLHLFKSKLTKILNISSDVVLKLCRIEVGSIKLTFQIPHFVQQAIFPLTSEQESALAGLGIVLLSCGDYHFYKVYM